MTSIKLALKNIVRVKGRSILIGIIMLVIAISVLVSLSIQSGTEETLKNARKKLGNDVTLQINMQNMQKKMIENMKKGDESSKANFESKPLTEKLADKYTKSKYVSGYDYKIELPLTTKMKVLSENTDDKQKGGLIFGDSLENGQMKYEEPKLNLISNLNPKYQEEFKKRNKIIVDGRFYTKEEVKKKANVVLISKNLANLNKLKVGDNIEVKDISTKAKTVKLKIVGLYKDNVQQNKNMPFPIPYMDRDNTIYSPITTARKLFQEGNNKKIINSAKYFINDPKNITAFKKEVKESKLDLEKYTLDANDEAYKKMAGPLEKLNSIIKIFLIIVVITGSAIMILIMTMTTRERKQEVGILRSLGVKRRKIAFQFITETLLIVSIALTIGSISGKAISQKAADYLLQREVSIQKQTEQKNSDPFGNMIFMDDEDSKKDNVETIDKIETKVSTNEILTLIFIGLFISSCGSIVSSYWIMKYEPMKILNNRV